MSPSLPPLQHKPVLLPLVLFLGILLTTKGIQAQCTNKITTVTGFQQFDCTAVTVTPEDDVDFANFCYGPYWIGAADAEGSFTFSFSPPVVGVTIDFTGFDNHELDGLGHEEVAIEINGSPYPLPDAGLPSPCQPIQAIVTPWGNLMAPLCNPNWGCHASCKGVQIDQTISTIKITDLVFGGPWQAGVTFSIYFCCGTCLVDAGIITAPPRNLCPDILATVPAATHTYLPPGTLLQYILFSDPNDTLGSILAISNAPSFGFDPTTMQTGTTYYIAAIAGEELNNNVDLNSLCLNISNAIEVIWSPWPTVVFSVDNPNICVGNCTLVTTTFTGEPPFTLIYSTSLTGPITKVFTNDSGTIEICAPLNLIPGSLNIQAITLTDAHCTCN